MKKIVLTVMVISALACHRKKAVDPSLNSSGGSELNTYLSQLQAVQSPAPVADAQVSGDSISSWTVQGATFCKSAKYRLGPEYNEGFLLNPVNDVLFLGAVIDGNSIYDGSYRLVSLPRTGGTLSTDLTGVDNSKVNIDETVKSKVQQGTTDLLNQTLNGTSAAQMNFELKDIYSAEQVDMQLGFTYGYAQRLKIKGGYHFNKKEIKSRVLVKFQQIYYSISYDAKHKPADYFQAGVTAKQVSQTINGTDIAPVYVSNVKYGRLAFYTFESTMSQKALNNYLQTEFRYALHKGDANSAFQDESFANSTTITGTIIGGSGSDAVQSINGIEGLKSYILKGGDYSKTSPGAPIAFTLKRITDNQVFSVVNVTEYTVNQCYATTGAVTLNTARLMQGVDDRKLSGNVKANLRYDGESASNGATVLWSQGNDLTLPASGIPMAIPNASPYNIVYDPSKFERAYLEVEVDLINRYDWKGVGSDKNSWGWTNDKLNKIHKLYLKDIVAHKLGSDWSQNNTQLELTYDLALDFDGEYAVAWLCKKGSGSVCTRGNFDVSAPASKINLNFSIHVNKE